MNGKGTCGAISHILRFSVPIKGCYVCRRVRERLHPHWVTNTVKLGGGTVMVWGCFTIEGIGPLVRVKGIMKQKV